MANVFKNKYSISVGTTATAVNNHVTAIGAQETIIGLSVANILPTTVSASVYHRDIQNSANTYLIRNAPILPGSSLVVAGGDQKFVLTSNNSIYAVSNTAASIDVFMSLLEITP